MHAKVSQDLHADAVVSLIGLESKAFVGLYGVESFILQVVGPNLVGQANPSSFLVQVKQHSTTFRRDPTQGFIELSATVTTSGTQNIAGKALRVHPHEYVLPVSYLAANKSDVSLLVDLILECVKAEFSVFGWQLRGGDALHHRLCTHPVGNQVGDGDEWNVMSSRKSTELWHPSHGAVLVHDFADDSGRTEAGQSGQVDSRFGLPGAFQHSGTLCAQWKDVTWTG